MSKRRLTQMLISISIVAVLLLLIILNTLEKDPIPVIKDNLKQKNTSSEVETKLFPIPDKPKKDLIEYIKPTRFKQGVYWKIEKQGYQPSYLLGTIHVDDPRVLAIRDKIAPNFKKASMLCTEVELNYVTKYKFARQMVYPANKSLKDDIGEALYEKLRKAYIKAGSPFANKLDKFKPWAAWIFLVKPVASKEVLDQLLYSDAILQHKALCGLEDTDDHINVFANISLAHQVRMLEYALDNMEAVQRERKLLIELYLERNLDKVHDLIEASPMIKDQELVNDFFYRAVIKRNVIMVNSMLQRLPNGNVFFAVGALHLPGKSGILQLLESAGYKLTRLH